MFILHFGELRARFPIFRINKSQVKIYFRSRPHHNSESTLRWPVFVFAKFIDFYLEPMALFSIFACEYV